MGYTIHECTKGGLQDNDNIEFKFGMDERGNKHFINDKDQCSE